MNETEAKEALASQHFWYVVLTIVFFVGVVFFVRFYGMTTMNALLSMSPFHFIILMLATFRITRLIVMDHITLWLRDLCMIVSAGVDPVTGLSFIVRTKRVKGIRRSIGDLFGCQWCMGIWVAFLALVLYVSAMAYAFVAGWILLIIFALAGGASLVQTVVVALMVPRALDGLPSAERYKAPWDGEDRRGTPNVCVDCGS